MVRPMVHSKKHYVQFSITNVAFGALATKVLVSAVAPEDVGTVSEVVEGATVKAIYLELWGVSDDATVSSNVFTFEKRPSGHAAPSTTEIAALGDYDNKKNVLYTQQGLLPSNLQNPVNLYKGWIAIPKSKQRMGLGDLVSFTLFAQSDGMQFCGFATYKEYT